MSSSEKLMNFMHFHNSHTRNHFNFLFSIFSLSLFESVVFKLLLMRCISRVLGIVLLDHALYLGADLCFFEHHSLQHCAAPFRSNSMLKLTLFSLPQHTEFKSKVIGTNSNYCATPCKIMAMLQGLAKHSLKTFALSHITSGESKPKRTGTPFR